MVDLKEEIEVSNSILKVPAPRSEPLYDYAPGSPERSVLQAATKDMLGAMFLKWRAYPHR